MDDAIVTRWLNFASLKHNATQWGSKSDAALKCLTAHLVELHLKRVNAGAGNTGGGGVVSSRRVGSVAVQYATPMVTMQDLGDASLATTGPGSLYLDLRSGLFVSRVI